MKSCNSLVLRSKEYPIVSNNCIVNDISPSTSVRDLGVVMDHELNLQKHINNTCRSAAFGICKIGKLRRFLDQANTERLVHAFVTTHLDYLQLSIC